MSDLMMKLESRRKWFAFRAGLIYAHEQAVAEALMSYNLPPPVGIREDGAWVWFIGESTAAVRLTGGVDHYKIHYQGSHAEAADPKLLEFMRTLVRALWWERHMALLIFGTLCSFLLALLLVRIDLIGVGLTPFLCIVTPMIAMEVGRRRNRKWHT